METTTILLNGVTVSGVNGTTILELADESGVYIPTLCHDPNLTPAGACRLCLVEDERNGALFASCVTPISPGMNIRTHSPRVIEHRKKILKLLLASHPDTCMVCDKGNSCRLHQLAAEMGVGLVDYQKIPQSHVIEDVNPYIERDLSKCVTCGKCIRVDQELVGEGALDYYGRGSTVRPATFADTSLEKSECTFCGSCIAACPTGALMPKNRPYAGTAPVEAATICPYCGCGCTLVLGVKDGTVVSARPASDGPVNRGTLCVRGSQETSIIHDPERLSEPLIREDSEFRQASWEEALELIAGKFKSIISTHGPDSLGMYTSARCTNEETYLFQRFVRTVIGTSNIDNGSHLYNAAAQSGLGMTLGYSGNIGNLETLENSRVIMIIGANPEVSAPIVAYAIKRAVMFRGAQLIIIDPRRTPLNKFACLWLRPRPGTDVALLNGIADIIIRENLMDDEFVYRHTDNFRKWAKSLKKYTDTVIEGLTGVTVPDIRRAAHIFAKSTDASIVYGSGITQQTNGADAALAIGNLAMLTGNDGRQGGIYFIQRECNAQGVCDMGALPGYLPGYRDYDDEANRRIFEGRWKRTLPAHPGFSALQMIEQVNAGDLKGMLIIGENPVVTFPRPSRVNKALSGLDFLVVADTFLTETAALATVVLPAASFAEKEGTYTNLEGRIQQLHKVIDPVANSLPEGEIILRLAAAMGSPMPYLSHTDVFEEIQDLVPFYRYVAYPGTSFDDMDLLGAEAVMPGRRRLHGGIFPNGFGVFHPVDSDVIAQQAVSKYPFTLIIVSGQSHIRFDPRNTYSGRNVLEIGHSDANANGICDGDTVNVISTAGRITAVSRLTDTLPDGTLSLIPPMTGGNHYTLFDTVIDTRSGAPALKTCAVRLERS